MILAEIIGYCREGRRFLQRLGQILALIFTLVFLNESKPIKFRKFFEEAGGAFIKFGQILALRHDILSPSYIEELLKLLSKVKVESFSELEKVFISEYGRRPKDFFKTFNPEPIASASISQVYQATLSSGEEVAVKIQRPGIKEVFERDFILASFLAGLVGIFRIAQSINIHNAVAEFIIWTRRELDFRYEARNGAALYRHSARHPDTVIPKVYLDLSTERVLITEYMRGVIRLDDIIVKLDKNPNLRRDLLRDYRIDLTAMSYYFIKDGMRQYFIDGFFHADPHPANVFLLSDNRLGYFDFGIMGEVGKERVQLLKIMNGLARGDLEQVSKFLLSFSKRALAADIELFRRYKKLDYARYTKIIEKIEEIITNNFRDELEIILAPWYERAEESQHSLFKRSASVVFSKLFLKAEEYSVYLPREVTIFFRGLIIADMVALKLCPEFNMIQAFKMFFQEFPLERAVELIEERTHQIEFQSQIDPIGHLDFEQLLELKAVERERLSLATERLGNLVIYYAERYDEVRKLL